MSIILTEGFDLATSAADFLLKGFSHSEGFISTSASKWSTPVLDLVNTSGIVLNFACSNTTANSYVNLT